MSASPFSLIHEHDFDNHNRSDPQNPLNKSFLWTNKSKTVEHLSRLSIRISLLFFTVMVLSGVHGARAADYQLLTSVELMHEYNDNIFFDSEDLLSDNITTVAPKLSVVRHGERMTFHADGKLEFYRYQEYDAFDDTDQWYHAGIDATPTERWQVGAKVHISDDSRADRDIETTGMVFGTDRRRRIHAGTSAFYTFSEMLSGGLVLNVNRENFDDPETSDRKDYGATLAVTRRLDAWLTRTTGRLNLSYSHYAFEREFQQSGTSAFFDVTTVVVDQSEVDNVSFTVGTETALKETVDLTANLGGRYARSQRELFQTRTYSPPWISDAPHNIGFTSDSCGFVGDVTFGYRDERYRCSLLLSHDLQPVSGNNAMANRTTIRLGGNMRLLEKLSGNLAVRWYWNVSDEDDPTQDDIDTQSWSAHGGLRWTLNDNLDLAADYVYSINHDRESGTNKYRNKAVIRLDAHHDWLE